MENGTKNGKKQNARPGAVEHRYRGGHAGRRSAPRERAEAAKTPPPLPDRPWESPHYRPLTGAEWARNIGIALAAAALLAGILWALLN